jgi:predicted dehydrogenase
MDTKLSERKILKGAIVGFGFISSTGHLPAYLNRKERDGDVEIIAICDVCPDRIVDVPAGVTFYTDYQELILKEKLHLDFLDVATHAADHHKISKFALENGIHVLCEKPLTTSIAEAEDLINTAMVFKKVLFPCHNYKYAPVVMAIREIIKQEKIGKINAITLNTFRNTHALGVKEWKPDWRRYKDYSGGGIAMDHGSHSLYLTFEWLGSYPKSVTASSQNLSYPKFDTEDNFSAVYEFENGFANIHLTWTAGVRKVLYTLHGEKGAVVVDDDRLQLSLKKINNNKQSSYQAEWVTENYTMESHWMDSSHLSWFNSMFDNFKQAILLEDIKNKELLDAFVCIHSISKAYESIENNSIKLNLENSFSYIYNRHKEGRQI